jgi:hypothetical protein
VRGDNIGIVRTEVAYGVKVNVVVVIISVL